MRVLIAPDCFGGTLSATEAADAIASGWRRAGFGGDELVLRPLSDGGPGFVDVLYRVLGGELHEATVHGPLFEVVEAVWLEHEGVAYVESAQACGLHLVDPEERDALAAHTVGVGELVYDAYEFDLETIVVGLGGSASTDGGAGLFNGLNAIPLDRDDQVLPNGGGSLIDCGRIASPVEIGDVRLIAATDVENPLLGEHGAARTFGPQKGADELAVRKLERGLTHWAEVLAAATGRDVRNEPGAGAAGGLGAAMLALGATIESGAGLVRRLTGLDEAMDQVDLVITGEGSFDWQSLRGKLAVSVASAAAERGLPCLVLAGQVSVGRREAAAAGVERAYAVAEHAGSVRRSMADPHGTLAALAGEVAKQWRL